MNRWVLARESRLDLDDHGLRVSRRHRATRVRLPQADARAVKHHLERGVDGHELAAEPIGTVTRQLHARGYVAVEARRDGRAVARFEPGPRTTGPRTPSTPDPGARVRCVAGIVPAPDAPEIRRTGVGDAITLLDPVVFEDAVRAVAGGPIPPDLLELFACAGMLEDPPGPEHPWETSDALFHLASRLDTSTGAYGAGALQSGDVVREPLAVDPARRLPLEAGAESELRLSLADALGRRRTNRDHSGPPLAQRHIAALMQGSLRVRPGSGDPTRALAKRSIPTGGAISGLGVVVLVYRAMDLTPGAYEYDAWTHELIRGVDVDEATAGRWRSFAASAMHVDASSLQCLILFTLDYGVPAAKYDAIVYATALKEVGCALQAMGLISTDLGLAFCPIGGGWSSTAGLGVSHRVVVGEAAVGLAHAGRPA